MRASTLTKDGRRLDCLGRCRSTHDTPQSPIFYGYEIAIINEFEGRVFNLTRTVSAGSCPSAPTHVLFYGDAEIRNMGMDADRLQLDLIMLAVLIVAFRMIALSVIYIRVGCAKMRQRRDRRIIDTVVAVGIVPSQPKLSTA